VMNRANRFQSISRGSSVVPLQRARVRFSRTGEAAAFSHLQQIDAVRRALEASGWPVARSQAKKPKLKLSFGPAISLGYASDAEYCDVELQSRLDFQKAKEQLAPHLPPGYGVVHVKSIPLFFPSLEESLNAASYEVRSELLRNTGPAWEAFWQADRFLVTKKKADREEIIDARGCVRSWRLEEDKLELVVRFGPGRTLKPERIIQAVCRIQDADAAMGQPDSKLKVKRIQLFMEKSTGELVEP
jgi:radical SAM-linked protein